MHMDMGSAGLEFGLGSGRAPGPGYERANSLSLSGGVGANSGTLLGDGYEGLGLTKFEGENP